MAHFKISAPGRIVLSGEHSAAYEKTLLVAGLSLRTRLEFCELSASESIISIHFPRVGLKKDIPLEIVENYFFNTRISELRSNLIDFFRYVTYFITMHCSWETFEQRYSLHVFFYLFYYLTYDFKKRSPFRISVTTEIPLGNGLGSSTSFAACLAGCFLHWRRLLQKVLRYKNQKMLKDFHLSQPDFDTISEIASQFEYGAKLTGFSGGFAYIVLRPNLTDVEIQHLQEQFTNKNFTTKIATIDCAGVTIDN
ncbi:mevalonate kinase-like isoform X2 [Nylanderia fulva]|uniref:mevalonate kinase-like isoform X2 n=1 Tax=Nylanderia fulva TaxID=613905 RepID=UPI0010FB5F2A|nr:mevalonate kinase-like isoform X2 [Nylanderia fulva]